MKTDPRVAQRSLSASDRQASPCPQALCQVSLRLCSMKGESSLPGRWPGFQVCRQREGKHFHFREDTIFQDFPSFNNYLLSGYSVLSILLGIGDVAVNRTGKNKVKFLPSWIFCCVCVCVCVFMCVYMHLCYRAWMHACLWIYSWLCYWWHLNVGLCQVVKNI